MPRVHPDNQPQRPRRKAQCGGEHCFPANGEADTCSHYQWNAEELRVNVPDTIRRVEPKKFSEHCQAKTRGYAQNNYEEQFHGASWRPNETIKNYSRFMGGAGVDGFFEK